jgi:hypothetical protein
MWFVGVVVVTSWRGAWLSVERSPGVLQGVDVVGGVVVVVAGDGGLCLSRRGSGGPRRW